RSYREVKPVAWACIGFTSPSKSPEGSQHAGWCRMALGCELRVHGGSSSGLCAFAPRSERAGQEIPGKKPADVRPPGDAARQARERHLTDAVPDLKPEP